MLEENVYSKYLDKDHFLASGKEVAAYRCQDLVIKVFHEKRISPIERISDEGLVLLSKLDLQCFNKPLAFFKADGGGVIVQYIEKYIGDEVLTKKAVLESLDMLKEDIYLLSENGFCIDDLYYNAMCNHGRLLFTDMTSYHYIKTNVPFLKEQFYKKNVEIVNIFLIGYLLFDAFKKGSQTEYTKIYQAVCYNNEYCKGEFFGDFIKKTNKYI